MTQLKKIFLDMQSKLYAKALQRVLVQELDDCQVIVSESPVNIVSQCKLLKPDVLFLEVNDFSPWQISERLTIQKRVRMNNADCKILLIVDENNGELVEMVKNAKYNGQIDAFLFTSATENYLVAVTDSL